MKTCIRVPRVFLPRENYESWAILACDRFDHDREYWRRAVERVGIKPSALSCIVPDVYLDEDDTTLFREARENQYEYLENGKIERLNRGMILLRRETSYGLRRGILANIDLEEYSPESDKNFGIRATTETLPSLVESRMKLREASVLEFPHTVLLYRDKKDKLLRSLDDDWELLYDTQLPESGGKITAYFIPDADAAYVVHDLIARADPCFAVADGNHSLAGAKAHWEEIKKSLSPAEARNHPARFLLAEFVNVMEESVVFEPIHRLVREIEPEAFCDFFSRHIKCKREKNILFPVLSDAESYRKVDETIREFLRQNFGKLEYVSGRPSVLSQEEDCAVVALPPVGKEELYAAVKSGMRYPAKTFRLGREEDARYSLEGREISYD